MHITNYQQLKKNSSKEYLGYCPIMGYIYSVQLDDVKYAVIALSHDYEVRTLITHTVINKEDK